MSFSGYKDYKSLLAGVYFRPVEFKDGLMVCPHCRSTRLELGFSKDSFGHIPVFSSACQETHISFSCADCSKTERRFTARLVQGGREQKEGAYFVWETEKIRGLV